MAGRDGTRISRTYHGRTFVTGSRIRLPRRRVGVAPSLRFLRTLLPGYAGNPNNNNGWLEADDYLLGELEAMVDELMVVPAIEEVAEPAVKAEEQMAAPVIDMEEDLAALFG
ncbi:hypothetical protein Tco_1560684 [Tanacetum coccineum]